MIPGACVLETEDLTRSFDGFTAVSRVSLRLALQRAPGTAVHFRRLERNLALRRARR